MTTTISSKGQITVPIRIREALGLTPGTHLEVELAPDGAFLSRKASGPSHFAKFRGMAQRQVFPDSKTALRVLRGEVGKGDVDR